MRDNIDEFIEDYAKVFKAHTEASPGTEREAVEKALKEIWKRRRHEKEAKQKQEKKK